MRLMTNALAVKVQQALDEQHLSLRDAGERCNLPFGVIASVTQGRSLRPKPETLDALSQGLGISYRELALAAYGLVTDHDPANRVPAAV